MMGEADKDKAGKTEQPQQHKQEEHYSTSRGIKIATLEQVVNTEFPEREPLLSPWLRDGESVMLFAEAGLGKSMFAMSLALAVAGGGEYLGWKAPKKRKVLYIDGEMHIQDIQERARMLVGALGDSVDQQAALANTTIIARQYQEPNVEFPDMNTEEGQKNLFRLIEEGAADGVPYDLVVLDNLSTLATIADENAASSFNSVLELLIRLKQSKTACILVHHSGKDPKKYRGSSKLTTTFEVMIGLERSNAGEDMYNAAFKMTWHKFRGRRDDQTIEREAWLQDVDDGGKRKQWAYSLSEDERIGVVLQRLKSLEYTTNKELADSLPFDCSAPTMTRMKQKLIAGGHITDEEWMGCMQQAKALRNEKGQKEEDNGESERDF